MPFLVLAPVFAIVLQKSADRPAHLRASAAIRTSRVTPASACAAYGLRCSSSRGVVCALAGMVFTARLANARANNALGLELDVITIALLGGVSVFGGKGRLTGVFWALVLVATMRNMLGLLQIGGDAQGTVIGLLLIGSLLLSSRDAAALRAGERPSGFARTPAAPTPGNPPEARSSPGIGALDGGHRRSRRT